MAIKLPIDVVPGSHPIKFRWTQLIDHLGGDRVRSECVGALPSGVEKAVADLIALAKNLDVENTHLKKLNEGLTERAAAQSEVLSRKAEASSSSVKKTKG